MVKDGRPTAKEPEQKYKQSDSKPFAQNPELLSVPHEVRSIQIASQFIELTEEENFAILYHNGMYGPFKYELQGKETPLYLLLHFADMWCSRVLEVSTEEVANE
jgi:23S rRNA maturation-related 3'-5' exoribonuclease YhaM